MLRDYQQRAIDLLWEWFESHETGHPCLVLPTGSGKSHIVAAICKQVVTQWPDTRILMLTHVKELIEQNAEKLRQHWPNAPLGIYSAGLRRKDLDQPITFGSIQSLRKHADRLGHVDLAIIDEAHLVGHKDEGGYRRLIADLGEINPAIRVVGLTATPYRLGHGYITDPPALFAARIEPVEILSLIQSGHLCRLNARATTAGIDLTGVHVRGGEYIESELAAAADKVTDEAVAEIIAKGAGRRSWLAFCAGVGHAEHVAESLRSAGIVAECITGNTPAKERDQILTDFKAGRIRAVTNANVLTTGFDHPGIDLIAMLRPTLSTALYMQMAGRGLRVAPGKKDCLVLDFARNVHAHGPVTDPIPPRKKGEKPGEAPVKVCPECQAIVHLSVMECPECGHVWERQSLDLGKLHDADIMGDEPNLEMVVTDWRVSHHISRTSGKEMVRITYYGALGEQPVTEYLPVTHGGEYGHRARMLALYLSDMGGGDADESADVNLMASILNGCTPPARIEYRRDGKFYRVKARHYG